MAKYSESEQVAAMKAKAERRARCLTWARESIASYLRWKMEGKAVTPPALLARERSQTVAGKLTLEEIVGEHYGLSGDLDHQNFLEISELLGQYLQKRPADFQLESLLVHCFHFRKPLAEFLCMVPFSDVKRKLNTLAPGAQGNAQAAIVRFEMFVADWKEEKEKRACIEQQAPV